MEQLAVRTDDMVALAHSRAPADRERLLMGMADLCAGPEPLTGDIKGLLQDIFMGLVVQAERDIRQRLAEKLAGAAWAPPALINILALDDIEIARPLIAKSPMLQDADLIRLLVEATLEHQMEVARRPNIGVSVVSAILDQSQPAVLTALADNVTAQASPMQMQRMVIASRRVAGMRGPLARHPRLDDNLAHVLYGWVGEALRANIAERFTIDPARLGESLSEAVSEAIAGSTEDLRPHSTADEEREQAEMERRLVAKLEAAGQLRPGYLLRALREGRRTLFEQALAKLGEFEPDQIARSIAADRPDLLALACAAVGIDRSVFPTVLTLTQSLNQGRPSTEAVGDVRIAVAFTLPPEDAVAAFRAEAAAI
ncbi:MAG TPA: DUF2336 domain-containing protein [Caulobacteraceae bacterium]|nr:DUF2336 domain-containing protein [Caulobacteraceae bacterium]